MGESFQGLRAVARVLIRDEAGEKLLLCRSRNGKAWVPPGGTLDFGETLSTAALREAEEEAGLAVSLGPMIYLQEFRPKERPEHVIEVAFLATALQGWPAETILERSRPIEPAGPQERPWEAWFIQDVDGPRREVRWFSREQLMALAEPVYPAFLRDRFWDVADRAVDPYLGLVEAK